MSPLSESQSDVGGRFPRVSGDEPVTGDLTTGITVFSPRERG